MSQKINFSDYSASGVYFLEIDNSVIASSNTQTALRLAVGFNNKGPFNRPVYISNSRECDSLFGGIDKKLERRGCFTNRNIRTMLTKAPLFVLNLLNVDTSSKESNQDVIGAKLFSLDPSISTDSYAVPYAHMYDRTKFWVADDEAFLNNAFISISNKILNEESKVKDVREAALFGFGNCGTKDISIIVRKSERVSGYNVTFMEYYGSQDDIPYAWINPNDYVSDYFVDVIAIAGDWDESNYQAFTNDVTWASFFTPEGLKRDKLNKFLRLDAVNVVGQWTGCIIPNFTDKQGTIKAIDYMINKSCNETGLMMTINTKALDYIALHKTDASYGMTWFFDVDGSGDYTPYDDGGSPLDVDAYFKPDFVGHLLTPSDPSTDGSTNNTFTYMSANINTDGKVYYVETFNDASLADMPLTTFTLDASHGQDVNIGDFVRDKGGMMSKIVKKRGTRVDPDDETSDVIYRFTAANIIREDGEIEFEVEIHKPYSEMYDTLKLYWLKGLTICNRHMPGYDSNGAPNPEAGVEKIYSMLYDSGINRGLLNDDSIDFRYIVDTMAYGLDENMGGKKYLSMLAMDKKHCTALINFPSMSQFAASDAPFFGADWNDKNEPRPTFDIAYIPQGGNQDMIYPADVRSFSLPDEEHGSIYAGICTPFLKYNERSRTILIPPAADVSNTFMNKFLGGDPYATTANLNGIISNGNIVGLEYTFDDTERGYLEKFGVNPIRYNNGVIKIYGDRTAYQIVDSDLNFLHVRELLNTIHISCSNVLDDYVFSFNIPSVRAEITRRINPILQAMKDSGALVKYEIQCDGLNNTKDVIDNKFCIVDIGVWISQNMEKIVVPITINRSTTATEE